MRKILDPCLGETGQILVFIVGLKIFITLAYWFWKKIIAPRYNRLEILSQGKWAVVTGATDGIGLAYAKELAAEGMNIFLISRSLPKLREVSMTLERYQRVETKILQGDITKGRELYPKVAEAIEGLEVGVLVNNAGATYHHPDCFENIPDSGIEEILNLNVVGFTWMIKAVLPNMLERQKGVIINIGSALSVIPSPYMSLYSASKAYVEKLSMDLEMELKPRGITVQCVLPGPVRTKMSKARFTLYLQPVPKIFVRSALKTVGVETHTTGYIPHSWMLALYHFLKFFSEFLTKIIMKNAMFSLHKEARERREIFEAKSKLVLPSELLSSY